MSNVSINKYFCHYSKGRCSGSAPRACARHCSPRFPFSAVFSSLRLLIHLQTPLRRKAGMLNNLNYKQQRQLSSFTEWCGPLNWKSHVSWRWWITYQQRTATANREEEDAQVGELHVINAHSGEQIFVPNWDKSALRFATTYELKDFSPSGLKLSRTALKFNQSRDLSNETSQPFIKSNLSTLPLRAWSLPLAFWLT